ncbi:hypothetical protein, partial [Pseudomonas sp.]|uniref:hypothetical protein n=1 Tax=Pseudomonas sp. TaxID=306 RepID=UPI003FD8DC85
IPKPLFAYANRGFVCVREKVGSGGNPARLPLRFCHQFLSKSSWAVCAKLDDGISQGSSYAGYTNAQCWIHGGSWQPTG